MTPLDQLNWWEFGLLCVGISVFGSFVKTFCLDNITSVTDIFKHFFVAIFIAIITCLYGNYKYVDKRLQLIFAGFGGIVGIRAIFYIVGKIGNAFTDIGKLLSLVNNKNANSTADKRKESTPSEIENRKRNKKIF